MDAFYFSRYSDYLKFEKQYSVHTVTAYLEDLSQFLSYIRDTFSTESIADITHLHVKSWLASLMDDKNPDNIEPRSVRRKLSSLKAYYRYLLKHKLADVNPMLKVTSPKMSKKLPVFVEQHKMANLLDNATANAAENKSADLIIMLLYHTGIRLSELINLKRSNIDLVQCQLKVLGKRNKERIIPFNSELKDAITAYEQLGLVNDTEFLIATPKGKKLYPVFVYRIVKEILSEATTQQKKSPHVLRHTFATHLLNNGADLNVIKELLGHANLSATQIYTQNSIDRLKKIHKLAHPKS